MGSSPVRVTSKSLNRTLFGLGILLFGDRMGMVKNPSVRAFSLLFGSAKAIYRRHSAEVLRSGNGRYPIPTNKETVDSTPTVSLFFNILLFLKNNLQKY